MQPTGKCYNVMSRECGGGGVGRKDWRVLVKFESDQHSYKVGISECNRLATVVFNLVSDWIFCQ